MHGGHVANDTASLTLHILHNVLREKVLSTKIDVEHFVELFGSDLEKGSIHGDPGVVDQTIHTPKKLDRPFSKRDDLP
jgi:hypothetical protein